jgi:S1-C subfamily serine protease
MAMGAMRLSTWAGVLGMAALVACTPSKPEEEPRQDIATLQNATVTLFPGHCAGVIVADGHHALTAAHCLDGPPGTSQPVVLRSGKLLDGVVKLVDPTGDLAVIRLDAAAPVRPLALAPTLPFAGEALIFAGRNDRPGTPQDVTLERLGRCPSLPGVPQALFTSLHGAKGDSGAPVVDHQLHVVGLVHGGAVCSIAAPTASIVPFLDNLVAEVAGTAPAQGVGGSGGGGR